MQVTKITVQLKNSDRVSVFLDNKFSFSLTINQLADIKLHINDSIDQKSLDIYKKMSADGKLEQKILNWLTIRPKSAFELKQYLFRNKIDPDEHIYWIEKFQKKGYQSDEVFVRWWIEQRISKNRSKNYIKSELLNKGINVALVEQMLKSLLPNDSEIVALKKIIDKKRRLSKYRDNQKLKEYLLRQGFSYSLVRDALAE